MVWDTFSMLEFWAVVMDKSTSVDDVSDKLLRHFKKKGDSSAKARLFASSKRVAMVISNAMMNAAEQLNEKEMRK